MFLGSTSSKLNKKGEMIEIFTRIYDFLDSNLEKGMLLSDIEINFPGKLKLMIMNNYLTTNKLTIDAESEALVYMEDDFTYMIKIESKNDIYLFYSLTITPTIH